MGDVKEEEFGGFRDEGQEQSGKGTEALRVTGQRIDNESDGILHLVADKQWTPSV